MDMPCLIFFMATGFGFCWMCFMHAEHQTDVNYTVYAVACAVFAVLDIWLWRYLSRKFWGATLQVDMEHYLPPDICPICQGKGTETRSVVSGTPTSFALGGVHLAASNRCGQFPVRLCLFHASEFDLGKERLSTIRVRNAGSNSPVLLVEIRSRRYRQVVEAACREPGRPADAIQALAERLAPMASLAIQREFMVGGQHQQRILLPEEVSEGAYEAVRYFSLVPAIHPQVGASVVLAVQRLESLLGKMNHLADFDPRQLVEENAEWSALRSQAAICLALLKFDLSSWERSGFQPGAPKPIVVVRQRVTPRWANVFMVVCSLIAAFFVVNYMFILGGAPVAEGVGREAHYYLANDGVRCEVSRAKYLYAQIVCYVGVACILAGFLVGWFYTRDVKKVLNR